MINWNGTLQPIPYLLSVSNRGFLYGDGVFDVLKYVNGKIYFWEEHYLRLMAAMRIVRMGIPNNFTMEFLEEEIRKTITANTVMDSAYKVRLTVTRALGNEYLPENNSVDYCISVEALESPFYQNKVQPYAVELYKDYYIQPDLLANLKTTNRILSVIGSIFAHENDYQNCILLNTQKNVVSFLDGNLFWVSGTHIKTPPLEDGCINGITRKKIIESIKKTQDFTIEECSISPFELQKADELFVTNTHVGIQSVSQYRKKVYDHTVATNLIGKLNTIARLG